MKFGRFEVRALNFGYFRLDGGAMFGSVPKNIWAKLILPDQSNCIKLATRCLLLIDGKRQFLVDVGLGEKWNERSREIFAIQNTPLEKLDFDPRKITDVVLTHLHFDHAGGISRFDDRGDPELIYPEATVHLQADNFENGKNPNLREKASYLKENVLVMEKARLNLVEGSTEIYPDLWVHQVNGHTVGQQWVELKNGNESLFYPTDLVPTSHHLPVPFNMGYDICAKTLLEEKERFLRMAQERGSIVVFEHDPEVAACKVGKNEKGHYAVKEIVDLS